MKKQLKFSLLLSFLMFAIINVGYSAAAIISPSETVVNNSELLKDQLSIDDILTKNRKGLEKKLGRKLKLKDRIALKLMKLRLKKKLRKGKSKADLKREFAKEEFQFNIGAFLLGFFIGLIGVLLVYLLMDRANAKSAWIGFGIFLIIYIILLAAGPGV